MAKRHGGGYARFTRINDFAVFRCQKAQIKDIDLDVFAFQGLLGELNHSEGLPTAAVAVLRAMAPTRSRRPQLN